VTPQIPRLPHLQWYAEGGPRRAGQLAFDLLALAWLVFWCWLAQHVHDAVLLLRVPGDGLTSAGSSLRDAFQHAADKAGDVPFAGHALADALRPGVTAGSTLVTVGGTEVDVVGEVAFWLAVVLVVLPLVALFRVWLPVRVRFARDAGAARHLRDTDRRDLLALHALAHLSLPALARLDHAAEADLADGWRRGDPTAVAALADHQLHQFGLRATGPAATPSAPGDQ
jgi:hypothetical protein